jgi:hypothetical protein
MKAKKAIEKIVFQVTDTQIVAIHGFIQDDNTFSRDPSLGIEEINPQSPDSDVSQKIIAILKGFNYSPNIPIILTLPRNQITSRFIKIPSNAPEEIERIVNLMTPQFLPYPSHELLNGYQTIQVDKEGYSDIHLVIVPKHIIERYITIFHNANVKQLSIIPGSFGLLNLYTALASPSHTKELIIATDAAQIEIAFIDGDQKLLFSRSFKYALNHPQWLSRCLEETEKTIDAFSKEVGGKPIEKIISLNDIPALDEFTLRISQAHQLPLETIHYLERLKFPQEMKDRINASSLSVTSLLGLLLKEIPETLNILPVETKTSQRLQIHKRKQKKLLIVLALTLIFTIIASDLNLRNKTVYLNRLKQELNKITAEAKPLELMEKKSQLLEKRSFEKLSPLEIISELHLLIPSGISLTQLNYEEDSQLLIKGQSQELNSVFNLVSRLENAKFMRGWTIKVRQATKQLSLAGEIVIFEVTCVKGK